MLPINPSHFAAISFLIFIGVLIWKRFFNVGAFLDEDINIIRKRIQDAAQGREEAYVQLKEMGVRLEGADAKVAEIIEKGRISCDVLVLSMRDEIAAEIAHKKTLYALHVKHLEEHFRKVYQEQLMANIFQKLTNHLKEQVDVSFHESQLRQSLALLNAINIAA